MTDWQATIMTMPGDLTISEWAEVLNEEPREVAKFCKAAGLQTMEQVTVTEQLLRQKVWALELMLADLVEAC